MRRIPDLIAGRRSAWVVVLISLLAAGALFALGSGAESGSAPDEGLPSTAESELVATALEGLPSADSTTALMVFDRGDEQLTEADLAAIDERVAALAELAASPVLPPATVSDDGTAALVVVPLDVIDDVADRADRAAELRSIANDDLPDGLSALMAGPEGFAVDLAAVFKGANFTLLLTTVLVVAVLLIITYRSPWLWLVPLLVIGLADGLAGIVARMVTGALGIELDASITGILSVLVFGAGTNYALLLIARYRDELRKHEQRHTAMAAALRGAGPAVIASGGTVALSLLTLLFAELAGNRALGIACAIGIGVAMLFALVVLPATLVLFGRWLFWPYVPRYGSEDVQLRGAWFKLGSAVAARPVVVVLIGAALLAGLAAVAPQARVGLAQTERFTSTPEAVEGQQRIADAFGAGSGSPATVIADADAADAVEQAALAVPGVISATATESDDAIVRIDVALDAAAETERARELVRELRTALHEVPDANAIVGGVDARAVDIADAQERDQALVMPLILIVVFVVLVLLLRALVAPVLLLATVVASFFASLGASWLLFTGVFDFPALDTQVMLFSFLFLVALGVDYNIFLVTRADEEARVHGTRNGMVRALAYTGAVITSAGILLAAVFAVLGVLPLITLTQIGIIVCVGVLLDTLLVRTVIVPALAFITRDAFWWPRRRRTGRHSAAESAAPVEAGPSESAGAVPEPAGSVSAKS